MWVCTRKATIPSREFGKQRPKLTYADIFVHELYEHRGVASMKKTGVPVPAEDRNRPTIHAVVCKPCVHNSQDIPYAYYWDGFYLDAPPRST